MMQHAFAMERAVAARIAEQAGAVVRKLYEDRSARTLRDGSQPLTEADLAAHRVIVEGLRHEFPGDAIVSEESGSVEGPAGARRMWVIDPLDGTREFLRRTGEFAVMVGLVDDAHPVLGVVYEPVAQRLWFATTGCGAFVVRRGRAQRIRVSCRTRASGQLRLAARRSLSAARIEPYRKALGVEQVVHLGSLGLKCMAVASGAADVLLDLRDGLGIWDVCAPEVIVREAGGVLSDATGASHSYDPERRRAGLGLIVSNATDHDHLVAFARPAIGPTTSCLNGVAS